MNKNYIEFKYRMDIFVGLIIAIIGFPFFLLLALLLLFTQGKPILFKHDRIGLNGELFKFYKFRTMKNIKILDGNPYICNKGDKRITTLGKFFRKYSLDEFPQIINIIKGEMSFVGPRPAVSDEFKFEELSLSDEKKKILRSEIKPGLTGLAQIKGRNSNLWPDKLKYDSIYIKSLNRPFLNCFLGDIVLIFLTFREIFNTSGEYDT